MNNHLTSEEIAAVVAGLELEAPSIEHLESCVACRAEAADLEELIRVRREEILDRAPDFDEQMKQVLDRLPGHPDADLRPRPRWLRPALALAAALVIAVGIGLLRPDRSVAPPVGEPSVEEILAEMDELLANDSIPGFEIIDPETDDLETFFDNGAS
jgi:anti-sigma factor RsiW